MILFTHPDLPGVHGGSAFRLDGVQYPRAWWRTAAPEDIEAMGFVPMPEPEPTLEERKAQLVAAAYARCQAIITGGFVSDALSVPCAYPSQFTDQINLMGSVTASLLPDLPEDWSTSFWCADVDGVWMMRDHSAAQIQQAGRDGKEHVLACQMHLDALVGAIGAAVDGGALDLIDIEAGWPA